MIILLIIIVVVANTIKYFANLINNFAEKNKRNDELFEEMETLTIKVDQIRNEIHLLRSNLERS